MSEDETSSFRLQDRLVLIAEDDPMLQEVILETLTNEGFRCLAFADAESLLATTHLDDAGCVVSDVCMPGMSGVVLQEQLARSHPHLPVLLVTSHGNISMAVKALKSGAYDFIEKPLSPAILRGRVLDAWHSYEHARNKFQHIKWLAKRFSQVTPREFEVIEQIMAGMAVKDSAKAMGISPRTVEHHRSNLLRKVNAINIHELIHLYTSWRNAASESVQMQTDKVEAVISKPPQPPIPKPEGPLLPVLEKFRWSEELSVGVNRLDEHHQKMIDIVNRLVDAISAKTGDPRVIVQKTLNDLSGYCRRHFMAEEAHMRRIGYEGLEEHILEHQIFRERMEALKIAGACDVIDPAELYRFTSSWLREHILGSDMRYRDSLECPRSS